MDGNDQENRRYLLDTSVYSQPLRNVPLGRVLERWAEVTDACCFTSRVCQAEVEYGLLRENQPRRRERYETLLRPRLQVLPVTDKTWECWSMLKARQEALGNPVADIDLLIAAAAMEHGLVLATLNARHFAVIDGLEWEHWGEDSPLARG